MVFCRSVRLSSTDSVVGGYVHNNGSYAAVVALNGGDPTDSKIQELANQVAQHIVAMDPNPDSAVGGADGVKELLSQPYLMEQSADLAAVLKRHNESLSVSNFIRWKKN